MWLDRGGGWLAGMESGGQCGRGSLTDYGNGARAVGEGHALSRIERPQRLGLHAEIRIGGSRRDGPGQEEEIVTTSGQTLTLLNPAVVSREVLELQERQTGIRGHLTSLKPLRADNRPDDWERQALQEFERGARRSVRLKPSRASVLSA